MENTVVACELRNRLFSNAFSFIPIDCKFNKNMRDFANFATG
jgi:hypothetical protein